MQEWARTHTNGTRKRTSSGGGQIQRLHPRGDAAPAASPPWKGEVNCAKQNSTCRWLPSTSICETQQSPNCVVRAAPRQKDGRRRVQRWFPTKISHFHCYSCTRTPQSLNAGSNHYYQHPPHWKPIHSARTERHGTKHLPWTPQFSARHHAKPVYTAKIRNAQRSRHAGPQSHPTERAGPHSLSTQSSTLHRVREHIKGDHSHPQ